jgi:hypothetical protein
MKKLLVLMTAAVLFTGCAHHYYRLDDKTLEIYLKAPGASSVLFASSLDVYVPHPASRTGRDTWVMRVPADREFSYFYKVDGRVFIPECEYRENDELGSENCVYIPGM